MLSVQTAPNLGMIVGRQIARTVKHAGLEGSYPIILEVGCGEGNVMRGLQKQFPQSTVYGCDLDRWYLRDAREFRRKVVRGTMDKLPVQNASIDLVVTCNVFDYATGIMGESIDFPKTIREIHRVLKVGGVYAAYSDNYNLRTARHSLPDIFAGFEQRTNGSLPIFRKE